MIDFLKALLRHIEKPLLIVWDRLPAHRSRLVREFIELSEGHIVTRGGRHRWKQPQRDCPRRAGGGRRHSERETVFSLLRLTGYYAGLNRPKLVRPQRPRILCGSFRQHERASGAADLGSLGAPGRPQPSPAGVAGAAFLGDVWA